MSIYTALLQEFDIRSWGPGFRQRLQRPVTRLQFRLGTDDVANGPHAASYRIFGSTRSAYGSG